MSDGLEVLFVSDNNGRLPSVSCFDPHVGTTLITYKGGNGSASNCLSIIGEDYILSVEESKPILHVWALNSEEPSHDLKMVLPGKPSALSVSPDGCYCVGGIDGKIYTWLISSGSLLKVVSKHYQTINKIAFTDDSSHFVTAGEDCLVLVWKLGDVVAKESGSILRFQANQVLPVYNFSQHSLPVTDIFIGRGNLKARLFTVSMDQTCKIFCLSSGSLLLSLLCNHVLTSVNVNELETELFLGTVSGKIQSISLDPYPRSLEHHVSEEKNILHTFVGHSSAVTCLSSSMDGVTLASGSRDGKVFLWNIPGRQLIRSFEMRGPVTNVFFNNVCSNIFSHKFNPSLVISKFEKSSSQEEKHLDMNVWVHKNLIPISFDCDYNIEENVSKPFEKKYENEDVEALKQEIDKLKEVNRQLYKFAMTKILKNPLGINCGNEAVVENNYQEM